MLNDKDLNDSLNTIMKQQKEYYNEAFVTNHNEDIHQLAKRLEGEQDEFWKKIKDWFEEHYDHIKAHLHDDREDIEKHLHAAHVKFDDHLHNQKEDIAKCNAHVKDEADKLKKDMHL